MPFTFVAIGRMPTLHSQKDHWRSLLCQVALDPELCRHNQMGVQWDTAQETPTNPSRSLRGQRNPGGDLDWSTCWHGIELLSKSGLHLIATLEIMNLYMVYTHKHIHTYTLYELCILLLVLNSALTDIVLHCSPNYTRGDPHLELQKAKKPMPRTHDENIG